MPLASFSSISASSSRRHAVVAQAGASKGFGAKTTPATSETCPCGSKVVYRECCEQYHQGRSAPPATASEQLRARFSAFVKDEQAYLVTTFHPSYLMFKYPDLAEQPEEAAAQLKRDVRMACTSYTYSRLKILKEEEGSSPDEAFVTFSYASQQRVSERRTGSRNTRQKAAPVDRNPDGSIKVQQTVERSRFVRDSAAAGWKFADYQLEKFPEWMQEAKDAELKSKAMQQQQQEQQQPQQ